MILIELLLPLFDNAGHEIDHARHREVAKELTERFGGLTAHTRAPATGLWKPSPHENPAHDEIVIFEVMTDTVDAAWWTSYRRLLESRFRQDQVLIRAIHVELL